MPLFPSQTTAGVPNYTVSTLDVDSGLGADSIATTGSFAVTSASPVANTAYFYPVIFRTALQVQTISIYNGAVTANSNMDLGLYDEFGRLVLSTGAVSQLLASASTYQKFAPSSPTMVKAGFYFAAAVYTSTSNRYATTGTQTAARGRALGLLEVASVGATLPASVTFAAKTGANGIAMISFHGTGMVF